MEGNHEIKGWWGAISKGGRMKQHTNGSVTWRQAQNKTKIYSWPWFEVLTDKKLCFLSREFTSLLFFTMLQCAITCYHVKLQLLDHFAIWFGFERESKCRMYAYLHYYLAQFILQWEARDKNKLKVTFHVRPTHSGDDKCHIPAVWCKVCPICLTN